MSQYTEKMVLVPASQVGGGIHASGLADIERQLHKLAEAAALDQPEGWLNRIDSLTKAYQRVKEMDDLDPVVKTRLLQRMDALRLQAKSKARELRKHSPTPAAEEAAETPEEADEVTDGPSEASTSSSTLPTLRTSTLATPRASSTPVSYLQLSENVRDASDRFIASLNAKIEAEKQKLSRRGKRFSRPPKKLTYDAPGQQGKGAAPLETPPLERVQSVHGRPRKGTRWQGLEKAPRWERLVFKGKSL